MAELELADHFQQQAEVIDRMLQGRNETQISKELNIPRKVVVAHLEEWREVIKHDDSVRDMAKQHLYGMSVHYQQLIQKLYEVIAETDDALQTSSNPANLLAQKTSAIKQIADLEEKRIKLEREAGLLEDNALADEILENERKQELLVGFLANVSAHCSNCSTELKKFMSEFKGETAEVPL